MVEQNTVRRMHFISFTIVHRYPITVKFGYGIRTSRIKRSHVKVSFDTPEYTANADGLGVLRILEAVRLLNLIPKTSIL